MDTFLSPYVAAAAIVLTGGALVVLTFGANRLLAPRGARAEQREAAEARAVAADEGWTQLHARSFVAALVYMVVVAGVGFLFPWAVTVASPGFGVPALVVMAVAAGIVAAGAVYAVKQGVVTWR